MSRMARHLLFYLSTLAFICLGFIVMVFALGYNFDFITGKLVKTGSFQIKSSVAGDVYLNDALIGKTSFLTNSFSRGRLLPRAYTLRVQNQGYRSWQKNIDISAGFLTDFPKIVLIPKEFAEVRIASTSFSQIGSVQFDIPNNLIVVNNLIAVNNQIAFNNDKKMEIIDLKTGEVKSAKFLPDNFNPKKEDVSGLSPDGAKQIRFNKHELFVDWLEDINYQPIHKTGDTELITRYSSVISSVEWYQDSNHLIINTGGVIKFIEIDKRGELNSYDITSVMEFSHYNSDSNTIYGFKDNYLIKITLN